MVNAVSQGAKTVEDAANQAVQGAEDMWDEASKAIGGLGREDNRSWWDDAVDWTEDQAWNAVKCTVLGPLCMVVRMDKGKPEILGKNSCSPDCNTQLG